MHHTTELVGAIPDLQLNRRYVRFAGDSPLGFLIERQPPASEPGAKGRCIQRTGTPNLQCRRVGRHP